jgi:signal transduction histidine kinase
MSRAVDHGSGIPPDTRTEIFERGYSTRSNGTGFGLSIVDRIVDAHNGTISVVESADGGARFEIRGLSR